MRRGLYRHGRQWGRKRHPRIINDQSTLLTTSLTIACPAGAGNAVSILWGDGTSDALVCDGVLKNITHNYAATGQYQISVVGDVGAITDFRINGQSNISGSLDNIISGLSMIDRLYIDRTSISGSISALANLPSMRYFYAYTNALLGGDLRVLSHLPSLLVCFITTGGTGIEYTPCGLPAFAGIDLRITSNSLSTTEIDNLLIDLADGVGAGGSLRFISGNSARSAASDAAYAALLAAGWGGDIT